MKNFMLVLISLISIEAYADLTNQMDALGANKDLMRKAKAIDPENRVRVVQNREVDRTTRLEIGVGAGFVEGGDPYTDVSTFNAQAEFHIIPQFSLGGRYNTYTNARNAEGRRVDDVARSINNPNYYVPGRDYARSSWLATANWYPIYGKLNLLDISVAQFDVYLLGGAGQITLGSGVVPLYSAGGGIGVWLSKHISTRFEARWQGYNDTPFTGVSRSINQTILSASMGFLF